MPDSDCDTDSDADSENAFPAALSGSLAKAPGSAAGYLLVTGFHATLFGCKRVHELPGKKMHQKEYSMHFPLRFHSLPTISRLNQKN